MGEIADMMLEGELCEQCGVYIGADTGYPTLCEACAEENGTPERKDPRKQKVKCSVCGRKVKHMGLADHMRDVHGVRG